MPPDPAPLDSTQLERYSRHLLLPQVGPEGQRKLRRARVLLIGAGGLGSPAALYLAAAGIGHLGLVDNDVVDLSNLQRQVLFDTQSVGQPKLDSAARRLSALNPDIAITLHEGYLDASNVLEVVAQYDLVIDGSDNFPTRYAVNDACVLLNRPLVYGALHHFEAQASLFVSRALSPPSFPTSAQPPTVPCYRCLFPEPPPPGAAPSCAEAGVLGVLPGVVGTIQATEAIKVILGLGEPLAGRLMLYDALGMSFREVRVRPSPDCIACGTPSAQPGGLRYRNAPIPMSWECSLPTTSNHSAVTSALPTPAASLPEPKPIPLKARPWQPQANPPPPSPRPTPSAHPTQSTQEIGAIELRQRLSSQSPAPTLLDVREPHETAQGIIKGAIQIPLGDLSQPASLQSLREAPSSDLVVYCRSGARSAKACSYLRENGFPQATNLRGGYLAWEASAPARA